MSDWLVLFTRILTKALWAHADPDEITYWREGNADVDWVVRPGTLTRSRTSPVAIEVRAGHARRNAGTPPFLWAHRAARSLTVGAGGIPLEDFLGSHPRRWLEG